MGDFRIFLIDHVWTFSLTDARDQLRSVDGLVDRVAAIVGVEQVNDAEKANRAMERIWRSVDAEAKGEANSERL